jgi:hypothetical protein
VAPTRTCIVCGEPVPGPRPAPGGPFTPRDLDGRPSEPLAAIAAGLETCACGYCAPALDEPSPGAAEVVRGADHAALARREDVPPLALPFLRRALLVEARGAWGAASDHVLTAAWAYDDEAGREAEARALRERALAWRLRARGGGSLVSRQVVPIDLARRAGRLDVARRLLAAARTDGPERRALDLELLLVQRGDTGRHARPEEGAPRWPPGSPAPTDGVEHGVVVAGLGVRRGLLERAAALLAETRGCTLDEARDVARSPVVVAARGVPRAIAEAVLARFQAIGVTGRVTSRRAR